MKRIINKTVMAVILALSMVLALFSGLLFVKHNDVADAAATPMTVTFTTDKASVYPGGTFKLTMKIEVTGETGVYHSVSIFLGLLSNETTFDSANQSLFTFSNYTTNAPTSANVGNTYTMQDTSGPAGAIPSELGQKGMYKYSLSKRSGNQYRPLAANALEMSLDVTVDANTPIDTSYKFGAQLMAANYVNIDSTSNSYKFDNSAKVTVQDVDILVKNASNDNNLDTPLKVGQGDDASKLQTITTITETGMPAITVTDPSLPLSVLPITHDAGATVKLLPGDVDVKSGEIGKVDIPANGKVTIEVTAENGDKKTYELTITVKGAALSNLVVANNTAKTGLTKNNLDLTATSGVFDPAIEAYTVYVPNDSTQIDITPTVNYSKGGDSQVDLVKSGSFTSATSATSGTMFSLTDIKDAIADNDTLQIKCKDVDGYVTKTYTLTFDVVDVDTSLDTVTVAGTNNTFTNSELRATENSVDYYYMIVGQTTPANVTVTATSAEATISLTGTTNKKTVSKALNANTTSNPAYTITVLAEAGNSETYTMILKNQEVIKLASDATADFVYRSEEVTANFTYQRIASYKMNSLTHGIDDVNFAKVVIGKVSEQTVVNDFLANFDSAQRSRLRIYNYDDELVYDCGNPGADFDEDMLSEPDYETYVTTGWRVELMVSGNVEDVIYVSMLGDVTGDGYIDGDDINIIVAHVGATNTTMLDDEEFFLAALISNAGYVSAADITEVAEHANRLKNIHDDYYGTF